MANTCNEDKIRELNDVNEKLKSEMQQQHFLTALVQSAAGIAAGQLFKPVSRKLSELFWRYAQNTDTLKELITKQGSVEEQLRKSLKAQIGTDQYPIYTTQNVLNQMIRNKAPSLANVQSLLTSLAYTKTGSTIFSPISYFVYSTVSKMIQPTQRVSLTNYLLASGAIFGAKYAESKYSEMLQLEDPDTYAKYMRFKQNFPTMFPVTWIFQQKYAKALFQSTKGMFKEFFSGHMQAAKSYQQMAGEQLFGVTVGSFAKQAQVISSPQMQQNIGRRTQVGLRQVADFKHIAETYLGKTLDNLFPNIYAKWDIKATGRSRTLEDRYMRLINWVLNAPEDDLVLKQFVSSLNERLGKINVAKMYAGYEPVTFLDIQKGIVKATDIFGDQRISNTIEKTDIYNRRIQELVSQLGRRGLQLDLPIGYGIYHKGQEVLFNPPGVIKALFGLSTLQQTVQIPYLGFNPISVFQPNLQLNWMLRPHVQIHEQDKYVPTIFGLKDVQTIQKQELLSKYKQRIINQAKRIRELILNTETGIAKELGFSPELVKQLIEYSGSDAEQQQKLTVQLSRYFFDLSEPNYEENAYKRSRRLLNLLKMTKIVIDKGETENFQSSTLQSVISQIQDFPSVVKYASPNVSSRLAEQFQKLAAETQEMKNYILRTQKDQSVLYFGKKPFLVLGGRTFEASKIIYEGLNLPKQGLSEILVEVYAKQTGQIKPAKKQTFRAGARQNIPFYNDFNAGETFFQEMKDIILRPILYTNQVQQFADTLYQQKRIGLMFGIMRTFGDAKKQVYKELTTYQEELGKDWYSVLTETGQINKMLENVAEYTNIYNYQKYMQSKSSGEKRHVFMQIQNALEPSPFELKTVNRILSESKSTPIADVLNSLIMSNLQFSQSEADVLLRYGQFIYQIAGRVNKKIVNVLSSLSDEQLKQFFDLTTQAVPLNFRAFKERFIEQFYGIQNMILDQNLSKFFEHVIETTPSLKLSDELAEIISNAYIQTRIEKTHQNLMTEFKQLPFIHNVNKEGVSVKDYIQSLIQPFEIQNVQKSINEWQYTFNINWFIENTKSVFGVNYLDYQYRRQKGLAPTFEELQMFISPSEEVMGTSAKREIWSQFKPAPYKYDVGGNKYLVIQDIDDIQSFKDILRYILPDISKRPSDIGKVSLLSMYLHYIFARTSGLLEEIGLGRPNVFTATNQYKEFSGVMQKIQWLSLFGQVLGVTDQLVTQFTAGVVNPRQALVETAQSTTTGAVQLQNITGIGPLQRYFQQNFPGLLPVALGAVGGISGGLKGFLTFQSIGTLMQYIPYTKEFQLQVEGYANVPVYSQQGWEFGREPYYGGRIKEFRPSLFYLESKEWQYTPLLFGSKLEYQIYQQPFPTPLNLFGIIPMFSKHYEKKLMMYRPYSKTGSPPGTYQPHKLALPLDEYTGLYTIGSMMQRMLVPRSDLTNEYIKQLVQNNLSFVGESVPSIDTIEAYQQIQIINNGILSVRQQIGFSNTYTNQVYLRVKQSQQNAYDEVIRQYEYSGYKLSDLSSWVSEYLGFFGFAVKSFLLSGDNQVQDITIQTSDYYRSPERLYFQQRLGNIFGLTEFYRRLNQSQRWQEFQIHTLPNPYLIMNFPWLPNRFLIGDQYQQIPYGEVRLPGPGYEYIRGTVDQYGPIDIYRILQNIQPYSGITDVQEQIVEKAQDNLPPQLRYVIEQAKEEHEQQLTGFKTSEKPFSISLEKTSIGLQEYIGEGKFITDTGEIVEFRGFTTDVDRIAKRIFESKFVSIEKAYEMAEEEQSDIEQQLKQLEHTRVGALVPKDIGLQYRYYGQDDIRKQAILLGFEVSRYAQTDETQVDIRQNIRTNPLKMLWEQFQHMQSFVHEKFIYQRTAYEEYSRYYAYGQYRQLWQKPISDILMPSMFTTLAQNPILQGLQTAFTSSMMQTSPIAKTAFTTTGFIYGALGQLLTPQSLVLPQNKRMWEIEEETMYLKQESGEKLFTDYERLPSMKAMKRLLPIEHQKQFQNLQNQSQRDWKAILKSTPSYMRQMLREIYEAKIQQQSGRSDYQIEEDQRRDMDNQLAQQQQRIPDYVLQHQQQIDPDKYRSMIQLKTGQNLQTMSIYQYQVNSQLRGIEKVNSQMQYNYYDSPVYYIRQIQKIRGY